MNAKEAFELIQVMRNRPTPASIEENPKDAERLKAGGWKYGIEAYRQVRKPKPHNVGKRPTHHWRNVAHYFNPVTKEKIFYWDHLAESKAGAQRMAARNPVPGGFENFTNVARDNNTKIVITADLSAVEAKLLQLGPAPACRECEKMHRVHEKSQAIGEFLEWLQNEKHVHLGLRHEHSDECKAWRGGAYRIVCDFAEDACMPFHTSTEKLLAEFFEIDLNKVEDERRALLDYQRKLNECHNTEPAEPAQGAA